MAEFLYEFYLSLARFLKFIGVYAIMGFLCLLSLVQIPLLNMGDARQGLIVAGLYFWLIYRPALWPVWLIFILGLVLDLAGSGLAGLNAFSFLGLALIIRGQRRFLLGQPWHMIWAGFVVAMTCLHLFQSLIFAMTEAKLPNLWFLAANILISSLFYPFFHPLFMAYHRYLSEDRQEYNEIK